MALEKGDPGLKEAPSRHPTLRKAMNTVVQHYSGPETDLARIEINLLPSGEVTYRVYRRGVDEPEGAVTQVAD